MKLVEVRVTQAHRGLKVGEVVRVEQRMADVLTSQGRVQRLGGAPEPTAVAPPAKVAKPVSAMKTEAMGEPATVSAGTDEPPPETQEADVEFTPAEALDEAVAKPKRTRKTGRYNRRDMKAKDQ